MINSILTILADHSLLAVGALIFCVAGFQAWRLRTLPHVRYKGLHVYAIRGEDTHVHVPREILEIYKHIKDPSIEEKNESPPEGVKYKHLWSWSLVLLLPRLLAKVLRPNESTK